MRVIAILALVGVVGAACSAPSGSLDDYAPAAEDHAAAYTAEVGALRGAYATGMDETVTALQGESDGSNLRDAVVAEAVDQSVVLFASLGDALDRYIRNLRELDPPAAVSVDHGDLIAALVVSREGISPILEALPTATTFDQIGRIIAGSGFADAQLRVEAACKTLERTIGSDGMEVDLRCEAMG